MPCLNMEKYIKECIESVLSQTLTDIEVLIIDAGSTDGTLDILDSYIHGKHSDSRVQLIHSDKKSYGYQVNLGIERAVGEYIGIVDTDDRIVPDMYEILYPIAVSSGADYVKGTAGFFYTIQDKYFYQYEVAQFAETEYGECGIEVLPKNMPELFIRDSFCGMAFIMLIL